MKSKSRRKKKGAYISWIYLYLKLGFLFMGFVFLFNEWIFGISFFMSGSENAIERACELLWYDCDWDLYLPLSDWSLSLFIEETTYSFAFLFRDALLFSRSHRPFFSLFFLSFPFIVLLSIHVSVNSVHHSSHAQFHCCVLHAPVVVASRCLFSVCRARDGFLDF